MRKRLNGVQHARDDQSALRDALQAELRALEEVYQEVSAWQA